MSTLSTVMPLTGKTAVVTGASRSIGYGIALKLAQLGANVSVACSQQCAEKILTYLCPHTPADAGPRSSSDTPRHRAARKPPSYKR